MLSNEPTELYQGTEGIPGVLGAGWTREDQGEKSGTYGLEAK
jgi:hypothetical protein